MWRRELVGCLHLQGERVLSIGGPPQQGSSSSQVKGRCCFKLVMAAPSSLPSSLCGHCSWPRAWRWRSRQRSIRMQKAQHRHPPDITSSRATGRRWGSPTSASRNWHKTTSASSGSERTTACTVTTGIALMRSVCSRVCPRPRSKPCTRIHTACSGSGRVPGSAAGTANRSMPSCSIKHRRVSASTTWRKGRAECGPLRHKDFSSARRRIFSASAAGPGAKRRQFGSR